VAVFRRSVPEDYQIWDELMFCLRALRPSAWLRLGNGETRLRFANKKRYRAGRARSRQARAHC